MVAPELSLAAENGYFWRWNSIGKTKNDWNQLIQTQDLEWKEQVANIMKHYEQKTDGSYIDVKESYITWNFEHTNYMFGQLQARELINYIEDVFENLPIRVYTT